MKDRLNREEAEAVACEYNFSVFSGGLGIGNFRTNLRNMEEKAEQLKEEKADSGMETGKQGEKF